MHRTTIHADMRNRNELHSLSTQITDHRTLSPLKIATDSIRCRRTKDEMSRTTRPPSGDDNASTDVVFLVGVVVVVIIR